MVDNARLVAARKRVETGGRLRVGKGSALERLQKLQKFQLRGIGQLRRLVKKYRGAGTLRFRNRAREIFHIYILQARATDA